jgi:hypothetical protein
MELKEKKEKLLIQLKEEYIRLPEYDFFGESNQKEQYQIIFDYLENNIIPDENLLEKYSLLDSVINDFDSVFENYCN